MAILLGPYLCVVFFALQQVKEDDFMFGVSSDKSEAAKALLYPHPSAADMAEVTHVFDLFNFLYFAGHRNNIDLDVRVVQRRFREVCVNISFSIQSVANKDSLLFSLERFSHR